MRWDGLTTMSVRVPGQPLDAGEYTWGGLWQPGVKLTLGEKPAVGAKLSGDLGVTHGNKAGNDTVLRSYWANLSTGLVSDEVEELMMTPRAWGSLAFEK